MTCTWQEDAEEVEASVGRSAFADAIRTLSSDRMSAHGVEVDL